MKKFILLLITSVIITSCQTSHRHTCYQTSVLRKFDRPKHGKYIPERKRAGVNHPAVRVSTRKKLINE